MVRSARLLIRLVGCALLVLAGCARYADDGRRTGSEQPVTLPVLRPGSGGEMVLVPAGQFTMGDPHGPVDQSPHVVYVDSFYIDRYLVTQELYERVMGANPSKRQGEELPVERVQWTDAARFCNRCSELDGLRPCYEPTTWQCDFEADGYRLPTEAEWEYACRAGSTGRYCFGDAAAQLSGYAWFKPHSRGRPHPVGRKRPNRWGLFDMHGNLWEWCNDWYSADYYTVSPARNPRGPASGTKRVLRGGAWNVPAERCTAAVRFQELPVFSDACFGSDSYGFRRVRRPGQGGGGGGGQLLARGSTERQPAEPHAEQAGPPAADQSPANTGASPVERPGPMPAASQVDAAPASTLKGRLRGTIVFVSDRSGNLDIWRMNADGSQLVQLTDTPYPEADPRFSPDGKRIVYTSMPAGFPQLWLMQADGSGQRRVTDGSQPAWSPDGRAIAFIRDDQAYVRELASGRERLVTPPAWHRCGTPAWSPDGKSIAVASRHSGTVGIYIIDLASGRTRKLAAEQPCCTPQWSPDGRRMIFQTVQGHIHQIELASGAEEQITFGADVQHDARYCPDGSMIVFCRAPTPQGPWQLCVTDLDSEDLDFVTIAKQGSNSLPDWHR